MLPTPGSLLCTGNDVAVRRMCQDTVQMSDAGPRIFSTILLVELYLISYSKKALIINPEEGEA